MVHFLSDSASFNYSPYILVLLPVSTLHFLVFLYWFCFFTIMHNNHFYDYYFIFPASRRHIKFWIVLAKLKAKTL